MDLVFLFLVSLWKIVDGMIFVFVVESEELEINEGSICVVYILFFKG